MDGNGPDGLTLINITVEFTEALDLPGKFGHFRVYFSNGSSILSGLNSIHSASVFPGRQIVKLKQVNNKLFGNVERESQCTVNLVVGERYRVICNGGVLVMVDSSGMVLPSYEPTDENVNVRSDLSVR